MRILVLDDNEIERHSPEEYIVDAHDYREDDFTQTINIKEFVRLFFTQVWDEVWIDHDLGFNHGNGRAATKEIYNYILGSNRKMNSSPKILITTMNVSVANTMVSDLVLCGLRVFHTPISSLAPYGISRGKVIS